MCYLLGMQKVEGERDKEREILPGYCSIPLNAHRQPTLD